jgi:hypothetical protein
MFPYPTDPITAQGIVAARSGRPVEARRYFEAALSQRDDNVVAWWWLAKVASDQHARNQYLEQCRGRAVASQAHLDIYRRLLQEDGTPTLQIYQLNPKSRSVDRPCPFDGDALKPGDLIILCPNCGLAHHVDCWEGNAYHCLGFACDGTGLVNRNMPAVPEPAAARSTEILEIDESDAAVVTPYADRETKEKGFMNKLRARAQAAMAADFLRQAAMAHRARQVRQQQEQARAQRERERAMEAVGRVALAFLAGLIPGVILAIAANPYFQSWLIFAYIVFLSATTLSTVAGHAMMETDRLTSVLYWLFPKVAAALILYFSFQYWERSWQVVLSAYFGGAILEQILRMRAFYERRTFLTYSTIALLALFAFRYFSVNTP